MLQFLFLKMKRLLTNKKFCDIIKENFKRKEVSFDNEDRLR